MKEEENGAGKEGPAKTRATRGRGAEVCSDRHVARRNRQSSAGRHRTTMRSWLRATLMCQRGSSALLRCHRILSQAGTARPAPRGRCDHWYRLQQQRMSTRISSRAKHHRANGDRTSHERYAWPGADISSTASCWPWKCRHARTPFRRHSNSCPANQQNCGSRLREHKGATRCGYSNRS